MPTYTYACKKCSHETDVYHSMSAKPRVTCPACGSKSTYRMLGIGAGIIFKGSGFYETDYKGDKGKKAPAEKSDATGKSEASSSVSGEGGAASTQAKTESSTPKGSDSGKSKSE